MKKNVREYTTAKKHSQKEHLSIIDTLCINRDKLLFLRAVTGQVDLSNEEACGAKQIIGEICNDIDTLIHQAKDATYQ